MTVEPPTGEAFAPSPDVDGGARGDLAPELSHVLGITTDDAREWIDAHGQQAAEEAIIDYWGDGQ